MRIHSHCSLKKRKWAILSFFKQNFFKSYVKHTKNKILDFFQPEFFERIAHSLISSEWPERTAHGHSWAICSQSLISSELPEQIAYGRSFVVSDLSKSLTVPHLIWTKWANERMSEFPALLKPYCTSVCASPWGGGLGFRVGGGVTDPSVLPTLGVKMRTIFSRFHCSVTVFVAQSLLTTPWGWILLS